MQQKQVLELIETIVKPLRERIEHLQKQNEKLKTQITVQLRPPQEPPRRRSFSKEERGTPKKIEAKDVKEVNSPLSKKREEKKEDKHTWNHPKPAKPEPNQMKSPPPKDKNVQTPSSKARVHSKDKPQPEKPAEKKVSEKEVPEKRIVGGKKVDLASEPIKKDPSNHPTPPAQHADEIQE